MHWRFENKNQSQAFFYRIKIIITMPVCFGEQFCGRGACDIEEPARGCGVAGGGSIACKMVQRRLKNAASFCRRAEKVDLPVSARGRFCA